MSAPHPAKFSDELMPVFQQIVDKRKADTGFEPLVLDPFAGTGRIHELSHCRTIGIELEPEWAEMHPHTHVGNATYLHPGWAGRFDMVLTSPTYGNRMADSHTPSPSDTSRRITYTHKLGRKVSEGSTADKQWGDEYRQLHRLAWLEAGRVLKPGGLLVINVKDHVRNFQVVPVAEWHKQTCIDFGFELIDDIEVPCPGMRFGANGGARVEVEHVFIFTTPQPETGGPK